MPKVTLTSKGHITALKGCRPKPTKPITDADIKATIGQKAVKRSQP